jgi:hypothetical protein
MRQALKSEDDEFLARAGMNGLRERIGRERRRVALSYLPPGFRRIDAHFQGDRCAVAGSRRGARVREAASEDQFPLEISAHSNEFVAGFTPLPEISYWSNQLSAYSVRLEEAMRKLGERAALVAELASSSDRRRIHPV